MIKLDKEKATLLIPLYGKAQESRKDRAVLYDAKAIEIVDQLDFDFSTLAIQEKTNTMLSLRAKLLDNFTTEFLTTYPASTVLHLGCGLDSRCVRIDTTNTNWYDLDYPEVIEIRRQYFPESENYHLIPSSVTDLEWLNRIQPTVNNLVIAEGLFMYLSETEIRELLAALKEHLSTCILLFDTYSTTTVKRVGSHPSLKKTKAQVKWGLDDPYQLTEWNSAFKFQNDILFTQNDEIRKLSFSTRMGYKLAGLFAMARNAHRILVYQIG